MPDLTVVPEAGDEDTVTEEALLDEVTPERVEEVHDILEKQNTILINRLQMLGKAVNPIFLIKIEVDTLLDFVMENDDARKQYDTAVGMRLNEMLKTIYAQAVGAEVTDAP